MRFNQPPVRRRRFAFAAAAAALVGPISMIGSTATADAAGVLTPGNLLVSTAQWVPADAPAITAGTTQLPPNCGGTTYPDAPCVTANANGSYPQVFNNNAVDGNFGISMPINLEELNPTTGTEIATVNVPDNPASGDYLSTSFSSKSELALNQSTDGQYVTFMGYVAPPGTVDVSNADTPGAIDSTNSDSATPTYRAVAQLDGSSAFSFTETNDYSGNNGRAAVEDPQTGAIYTAGNGGNGAKPEPQGVVTGTGAQILAPANSSEAAQSAGSVDPIDPYGNFNAYGQLGLTKDKTAAKDNNYRGLTAYNNVIYLTKGSGSNGVDTVYYVDTAGGTCPAGSGVPSSTATLPSVSSWTSSNPTYGSLVPQYSTSTPSLNESTSNPGLAPTNTCVLNGFPTSLASGATDASGYPFGIWFANSTTLYVADEGAGDNTYSSGSNAYTAAAASTTAGLQKWSFNGTKWVLDYTLQSGLNLGQPYSVASSAADSSDPNGGVYPAGNNTIPECPTPSSTTKVDCPWTPATDGLRNITGQVNADGTVTIWASTSTVSGAGDQGADPNKLVSITDTVADTSASQASSESFSTVIPAEYGQVVRGVSLTPGSSATPPVQTPEVPWAPLLPTTGVAIAGGALYLHRRRRHSSALL